MLQLLLQNEDSHFQGVLHNFQINSLALTKCTDHIPARTRNFLHIYSNSQAYIDWPITASLLFPIFPLRRTWFTVFCIVCAYFAGCIPWDISLCCCYMGFIQRDTTRTQCCGMSTELLNKVSKLNSNTTMLLFVIQKKQTQKVKSHL